MVVRRKKIMKRLRVLIALRAVVISSVALSISLAERTAHHLRYFDHRLLLIPNP